MKKPDATFPLEKAAKAAAELVLLLGPACRRIEIAGSVRRGVRKVHDIDLVVWASYHDAAQQDLFGGQTTLLSPPDALYNAIRFLNQPVKDTAIDPKILRFAYYGIPVELYLAERNGANFEALWQMRTGPAGHNASLARLAQEQRLYYHAGHGIFQLGPDNRFGSRVDDGSEAGIYAALGLTCPLPANRYATKPVRVAA